MAITIEQHDRATNGLSQTITANFGATPTTGNLLLACLGHDEANDDSSSMTSSGWTRMATYDATDVVPFNLRLGIWAKFAGAAEATAVIWDIGEINRRAHAHVVEISGSPFTTLAAVDAAVSVGGQDVNTRADIQVDSAIDIDDEQIGLSLTFLLGTFTDGSGAVAPGFTVIDDYSTNFRGSILAYIEGGGSLQPTASWLTIRVPAQIFVALGVPAPPPPPTPTSAIFGSTPPPVGVSAVFGGCRFGFITPFPVLKVDGVVGDNIVLDTLSWTERKSGSEKDELSFEVIGDWPTEGVPITLSIGSEAGEVFSGHGTTVNTMNEDAEGGASGKTSTVHAVDLRYLLNRILVHGHWAGLSASTIASQLISRFGSPFTNAGVQPGGADIEEFSPLMVGLYDALQDLANRIGWQCYVDTNLSVHFYETESINAPEDLDESGDGQWGGLALNYGGDQIATQVWAVGPPTTLCREYLVSDNVHLVRVRGRTGYNRVWWIKPWLWFLGLVSAPETDPGDRWMRIGSEMRKFTNLTGEPVDLDPDGLSCSRLVYDKDGTDGYLKRDYAHGTQVYPVLRLEAGVAARSAIEGANSDGYHDLLLDLSGKFPQPYPYTSMDDVTTDGELQLAQKQASQISGKFFTRDKNARAGATVNLDLPNWHGITDTDFQILSQTTTWPAEKNVMRREVQFGPPGIATLEKLLEDLARDKE